MTTGFCCGQIPRRKKTLKETNLPDNPVIAAGVELIYLGAGSVQIKGKASGLVYYVTDQRRRFKADKNDVPVILKTTACILKP